jgi:short-subunit dehydrogenase
MQTNRKNSLFGKVVVITGASSGIGRATAVEFARHGANVVLTARSTEGLERTADECRAFGQRVVVTPGDVTNEETLIELARHTFEKFGHINFWVNNAGVFAMGKIEETPSEVFHRLIEINYFGVVNGCRAVLPYMRQQNYGVIINVGSEVSNFSIPYGSAYTSSKFAVRAFTSALRQELLDTNISVCLVMPASIDTPLFQHAANYSGRAIKPSRPVYPVQKAAETIVRLALQPQREVFVGNAARYLTAFHTLAPEMQERIVAKMVEDEHFQDKSAAASPGNLFDAQGPYGSVGGWQRRERLRTARESGAGAIA